MMSVVMEDFNRRNTGFTHLWGDRRPSQAEFDALKAEVQELRKLLEAAKNFDRNTGQPDCESEDKIALLRKIADMVGVDLSEVIGDA